MSEKSSKPWATIYDQHGDETQQLLGNAEGLTLLRDAIDEALRDGNADMPVNSAFDFNRVQLGTTHPDDTPLNRAKEVKSCMCLFLFVPCLLIALYGIITGLQWLASLIQK